MRGVSAVSCDVGEKKSLGDMNVIRPKSHQIYSAVHTDQGEGLSSPSPRVRELRPSLQPISSRHRDTQEVHTSHDEYTVHRGVEEPYEFLEYSTLK